MSNFFSVSFLDQKKDVHRFFFVAVFFFPQLKFRGEIKKVLKKFFFLFCNNFRLLVASAVISVTPGAPVPPMSVFICGVIAWGVIPDAEPFRAAISSAALFSKGFRRD